MLQKFLAYVIIWLPFQLLIDCQMIPPKQRLWHTATHIDNKLYILGGVLLNNVNISLNDFFYTDVSGPFNTKALTWQDLSGNTIPAHSGATTVVGGAKNNTLFLYGGRETTSNNTAMPLVYTFDPMAKKWGAPNVPEIFRRQNLMGINSNGKMYLWGGLLINGAVANDMLIFNTIDISFSEGSSTDAPSARYNYGGVLLPNQNIIYFGGYNEAENIELSISQIYIYDTISDKWNTQTTTGNVPSSRDGFTAVLGLDGQRIIIFGGTADPNVSNLPPGDSLYELNLNNFEWSIPKTSGQTPSSRIFHRVNVIIKYMVISFGQGYDQSTESDILLLDISNNNQYIWTTTFDLSTSSSPSGLVSLATQTGNITDNKPNNLVLIGSIIGSLLSGALLISGGVFLYKWKIEKNKLQINTAAIDHF